MFEHHPLPSCKFLCCFCSLSQAGESQTGSEVLLSLHDSLEEHRNNDANTDSKKVLVWSRTLVLQLKNSFSPAHLPHTGLILSGQSRILLNMKHNPVQIFKFQYQYYLLLNKRSREVVDCPSVEISKVGCCYLQFFFSNLGRPKPCKIINITKPHGINRKLREESGGVNSE